MERGLDPSVTFHAAELYDWSRGVHIYRFTDPAKRRF